MKNIIDIYPNNILDINLVVMTSPNIKDIQDKYTRSNGDPIEDNFLDNYPGLATILRDNETEDIVLVIILNYIPDYVKKRSELDQICYMINTIGHEAFHILMHTLDVIEDKLVSEAQEFPAYYIGWIVECAYRTWIKSDDTFQKRTKTKGQ